MILMDLVPSFVVVNKVGIGTNYAVVSGKVKFLTLLPYCYCHTLLNSVLGLFCSGLQYT